VEQRKHWWNGRWGRLARHDIFLQADGDLWYVEDRRGGAEGNRRWSEHDSEDKALEQLRRLMTDDGWREISA
jgi:hypothetical protein